MRPSRREIRYVVLSVLPVPGGPCRRRPRRRCRTPRRAGRRHAARTPPCAAPRCRAPPREHDLVPGPDRRPGTPPPCPAHHLVTGLQGEHLAAKDVVLVHERAYVDDERSPLPARARSLPAAAALVEPAPAQRHQDGEPASPSAIRRRPAVTQVRSGRARAPPPFAGRDPHDPEAEVVHQPRERLHVTDRPPNPIRLCFGPADRGTRRGRTGGSAGRSWRCPRWSPGTWPGPRRSARSAAP